MSHPSPRREFLRGLTMLPLLGGGVTLIGNPTRAAEPITPDLLDAYSEWLEHERRLLCREQYPHVHQPEQFIPFGRAQRYHFPSFGDPLPPPPSSRAAIVLAAVDCDWRRP